jgi:transposase
MKLHGNAALSLNGRRRMVASVLELGRSIAQAAEAAGVSDRTCSKWVQRYLVEGDAGLLDRSSAPQRVHNRTDEQTVQLLAALRRLRFTAPELADLLGMPISTISGILKRVGMGKLGRLGLEPAQRYERARPGELIHIDVKKLGRIQGGAGKRITGIERNQRRAVTDKAGVRRMQIGWDAVHVAVDDATRLAHAEVLSDEKATTAVAFLGRAIAFYRRHGSPSSACSPTDESQVDAGGRWWDPRSRVRVTDEAKRRPWGFRESAAWLWPSRAFEMRAPVSRRHPPSAGRRLASR